MSERTCPRLIEVALPIREISAETVRDKSLRHGHASTLHKLRIIQDPNSRLKPEMLYRQIQYLVQEDDWSHQGEEVPAGDEGL
jgi:hypothetical protein